MTIVEAIKLILSDVPEGLTAKEIYDKIVEQNLYAFGAKNPLGVVNSQIRRRCVGLNFPTAYPVKMFRIVGHRGKKNRFALYDDNIRLPDGTDELKSKNAIDELETSISSRWADMARYDKPDPGHLRRVLNEEAFLEKLKSHLKNLGIDY